MNKKLLAVTVLCGLIGMTELSASRPALYFTSDRIVKNALRQVIKGSRALIGKAPRGLGKQSHAALVAAKTVTSVQAAAVLPRILPSATEVYTGLIANKEAFVKLTRSAYGPVVQGAHKIAATAPIAQATKSASAAIVPFKNALAAGCATTAAGMDYIWSLFARTSPVPTRTAFQSFSHGLLQHKMAAAGLALATVTTAYCVRYKINPVTKVKNYFNTQVSK